MNASPTAVLSPRVDEAIEVIEIIEGVRDRCHAFVVSAEVDAGVNLEGCSGFKGHPEDCADLLANLIMQFTDDPERSELLYRKLRSLQIQKAAKKLQAALDAP